MCCLSPFQRFLDTNNQITVLKDRTKLKIKTLFVFMKLQSANSVSDSPPSVLSKHCKRLTVIMSESLSPEFIISVCMTQILWALNKDCFYSRAQCNVQNEVFSSEHVLFHTAEQNFPEFVCVPVLWQRWRRAWELLRWQKLFLVYGSHKPTWTERKGGERGGG